MNLINNIKDSFKSIEPEVLACYQNKLPDVIFVKMAKDKNDKYWAEIQIDNDSLFTEANSRDKLEDNVNRAVACYYEVPRQYIPHLLISKRYSDPHLLKNKKTALKTA